MVCRTAKPPQSGGAGPAIFGYAGIRGRRQNDAGRRCADAPRLRLPPLFRTRGWQQAQGGMLPCAACQRSRAILFWCDGRMILSGAALRWRACVPPVPLCCKRARPARFVFRHEKYPQPVSAPAWGRGNLACKLDRGGGAPCLRRLDGAAKPLAAETGTVPPTAPPPRMRFPADMMAPVISGSGRVLILPEICLSGGGGRDASGLSIPTQEKDARVPQQSTLPASFW